MGTHQKHAALVKPEIGEFGRNEVAIMGTPCGNIQKLAKDIIVHLKDKFSIAYIDADHKNADSEHSSLPNSLEVGGDLDFVDKIDFYQINKERDENPFQLRKYFFDKDLTIVNGNHFKARNQILVIDPKKDLQKKLDRISRVSMILISDPNSTVPDFLQSHIEGIDNIPVYSINDIDKITQHLVKDIIENTPKLKGLVLAGGKSIRMNQDKGLIEYYGIPQREYAASLLSNYCDEVFISCRPDQVEGINGSYEALPDTFDGLGPFGGIVSALRHDPNAAWLAIACDLPYLDRTSLDYLTKNRNTSKVATCFWDSDHKFPEPLITIWEPKAYSEMLYFLSMGHSCPRKVLINSNVHVMEAPDSHALTNVNNPEEMRAVLDEVKQHD